MLRGVDEKGNEWTAMPMWSSSDIFLFYSCRFVIGVFPNNYGIILDVLVVIDAFPRLFSICCDIL